MATEDVDHFADLASPGDGAKPVRTEPLSTEERLIVQNLFDTQPAKRAAYMKQIGLEVDPKDENKYRPLGSVEPYQAEIDPGIGAIFRKGGWGELMKDAADLGFDVGVTGPLTAAGGGMGGTAGAAVPIPGMAILGAIAGGAAGNASSEAIKKYAGDVVLDEAIPQDMKLTAMQSMVAGIAPEAIKGLALGGKTAFTKMLESRKNAIINVAKNAGGGVTPGLLERAAAEPEKFTSEAVKNASEKLGATYKAILGIDPSDPITMKSTRQIKPDSVLGQAVKPLNEAATAEVNKLAQIPEANWKVGELLQPLRRQIAVLSDKFSRTADEEAALKYLRGKAGEIEKTAVERMGKPGIKPDDLEIDYKQGRDVLKTIQDDAFNREVPGNSFLRQAVGGGQGQLRQLADEKAAKLGSNLPEINAKRAEIMDTFQDLKTNITPSKITSAYIGNDDIAKSETRRALGKLDAVAGTQYSKAIEDGALQRVVENVYTNPQAFGSGRSTPSIMGGAIKGAGMGAAAGGGLGAAVGLPGPGAAVGALTGGYMGAQQAADLSKPERIIPRLGELASQIESVKAYTPGQLLQGAGVGVGVEGSKLVNPTPEEAVKRLPTPAPSSPVSEDHDPFSDI